MSAYIFGRSATSEEAHGICKQPEPSCLHVDKALKAIANCAKIMRGYEKVDDVDSLHEMLSGIEMELAELVGYDGLGIMEDIRDANIVIRAWGQQWKEKALE